MYWLAVAIFAGLILWTVLNLRLVQGEKRPSVPRRDVRRVQFENDRETRRGH